MLSFLITCIHLQIAVKGCMLLTSIYTKVCNWYMTKVKTKEKLIHTITIILIATGHSILSCSLWYLKFHNIFRPSVLFLTLNSKAFTRYDQLFTWYQMFFVKVILYFQIFLDYLIFTRISAVLTILSSIYHFGFIPCPPLWWFNYWTSPTIQNT